MTSYIAGASRCTEFKAMTRLAMPLAAAIAMLLAGCGGSKAAVTISRPAGLPTATASPVSTPLPPLPTPDASLPSSAAIKAFVAKYGNPPQATAGRFRIPRLDVDAAISPRVVGANLELANLNPFGPTDVTWYDFSVNPRFGGVPGKGHNAIFAAHVDYNYLVHYAGVNYNGQAIFQNADRMIPGDVIEVSMGDSVTRFAVAWKKQVHEASAEWSALVSATVPEGDAITLISCIGNFDAATHEYDSRTVIRAKRV